MIRPIVNFFSEINVPLQSKDLSSKTSAIENTERINSVFYR